MDHLWCRSKSVKSRFAFSHVGPLSTINMRDLCCVCNKFKFTHIIWNSCIIEFLWRYDIPLSEFTFQKYSKESLGENSKLGLLGYVAAFSGKSSQDRVLSHRNFLLCNFPRSFCHVLERVPDRPFRLICALNFHYLVFYFEPSFLKFLNF